MIWWVPSEMSIGTSVLHLIFLWIVKQQIRHLFRAVKGTFPQLPTTVSSQNGTSHTLRWRHNDHAGVSNHQPPGCLLNRLFRRKSKKTSKLRVTGLCAGNSPGTGEFSAQMASYAENVSIWWRHHVESITLYLAFHYLCLACIDISTAWYIL